MTKYQGHCPECGSDEWDYANVGLPKALVCLNCGCLYGDQKKMTELEFECKFENGDLDCDFAMFISEHYDAWAKHQMMSYWEDPDAYQEFKDSLVTVVNKQYPYSLGPNPLDKFPSMWGTPK